MGSAGRFAVFVAIVLGVWTLMHIYVIARMWRLPGLGSAAAHGTLLASFVALWLCFPLARIVERSSAGPIATGLEVVGADWMGVLFLLVVTMLAADLLTGFGHLFPRLAIGARLCAVGAAALLSVVALVQGMRAPVVRELDVTLPNLPAARDGMTLVAISDLHVGTMIGRRWTDEVVDRINALHPDLVCMVGDLVEGDVRRAEPMVPALRRLRAPLGVWAVTGNHEYYAGLDRSLELFRQAGFHTLRDRWEQVEPGLILAGVDDLTARRQFGAKDTFVTRALAGRPPGATILLCHTPWEVDDAARAGVGLMLSGHTHDGQIWPFGYLVKLRYPYLGGRYQVGPMTLAVCRGTGTWGPRMRLWRPSEILHIRLHSAHA
jgi:uncharacterized protein